MGFKLPKLAREYFRNIDDRSSEEHKFSIKFDIYYLCLMIGLDRRGLGKTDEIESDAFIDYYPDRYYKEAGELIAALLIDAEMDRKDIQREDAVSVERLIVNLIDHETQTRLKPEGVDLLNKYAAYGMEIIADKIIPPTELATFIIQYHKLLSKN